MKQFVYYFLIWLSGADRDVLDKCSKADHIKHAGFGVLVIIPALLGAISMSYALSTLIEDLSTYVSLGIMWGIIVLFIDRFLISTLIKNKTVFWDFFSIKFLTRIVFSIGIGIMVSHPLVMLFFDKAIENRLSEDKIRKFEEMRQSKEQKINNFTLKKEINDKENELKCYQNLLSAEYSGRKEAFDCGFSSGLPDCGVRCSLIQDKISKLDKIISNLNSEFQLKVKKVNEEVKSDSLNLKFNDDYITRVNTLAIIKSEQRHVEFVEMFLMLFFILVDIIPVIFKVSSARSEYDDLLDMRKSNKIFSFQVESESDRTLEKELIEKFFVYKQNVIEKIFNEHNNSPIKDLLFQLKRWLGLVFDTATIGIEKKINPIEQTLNRQRKLFFYYALENPVVFVLFFGLVLYGQYIYLDNRIGQNQERWNIVVPMVITSSATLFAAAIPLLKKSKNDS